MPEGNKGDRSRDTRKVRLKDLDQGGHTLDVRVAETVPPRRADDERVVGPEGGGEEDGGGELCARGMGGKMVQLNHQRVTRVHSRRQRFSLNNSTCSPLSPSGGVLQRDEWARCSRVSKADTWKSGEGACTSTYTMMGMSS